MATHKSAKKRIITNEKARLRNRHNRSLMRNAMRKLLGIREKGPAEEQFKKVTSILDRLVLQGIVHRNKAAREKSRLAQMVNALS